MKTFLQASVVVLLSLSIYYIAFHENFDSEIIKSNRVLVTGASQNIGKQIALKYAKLGAKIVITARREDKLQEVVKECKQLGAEYADYIVADMNHLNQTKLLVDKAAEMLGGLDYLVLNHLVGVPHPGLWNASSFNLNYASKSLNVNLLSYIYLSSYAAPHLTKSDGHLVVISSLAGHINVVNSAFYGATKAALNHFYGNLRLELALQDKPPYSITVCLLGPIATDNSRWEKYPNKLTMKGTPVVETVEEVVRAAALRRAYVFVPKWSVLSGLYRLFATDVFDRLYLKVIYKR